MAFILPTQPAYTNDANQKIFWIEGAPHGSRTASDLRLLVIHHTAGTDSREYLWSNPLKSSSTYLVGKYPDTGLRVYKYMSETTAAPYTQGFGSIGPLDTANEVNRASISIETEFNPKLGPVDPDVFDATAKLAASILRYWSSKNIDLVLIAHKHIDSRKQDPAWDWGDFCKRTYGYM